MTLDTAEQTVIGDRFRLFLIPQRPVMIRRRTQPVVDVRHGSLTRKQVTVTPVNTARLRTVHPAEVRTIGREAEQFTINRSNHRRSLRQRTRPPNLRPVRTPRHTIRRVTRQRPTITKHSVSRTSRRIITLTRRQHVIVTMRSLDTQHHKPLSLPVSDKGNSGRHRAIRLHKPRPRQSESSRRPPKLRDKPHSHNVTASRSPAPLPRWAHSPSTPHHTPTNSRPQAQQDSGLIGVGTRMMLASTPRSVICECAGRSVRPSLPSRDRGVAVVRCALSPSAGLVSAVDLSRCSVYDASQADSRPTYKRFGQI
jgi:hypothetical protein